MAKRLKQIPSGSVYAWHPILAKRTDMMEFDDEQALTQEAPGSITVTVPDKPASKPIRASTKPASKYSRVGKR